MIPKELLAALRTIEIVTARLANQELSGNYHSSFKGQGLAFREVRPYMPGDDVRTIDWNVSAKMNEPFVKVFTEEREMTVMLAVDMSASLLWGTRKAPKARMASEVAALLAFSAIRNGDRVGLILGTSHIERIVPPKKGEKHVMRVIREILGFQGPSSILDERAASKDAPKNAASFVPPHLEDPPGARARSLLGATPSGGTTKGGARSAKNRAPKYVAGKRPLTRVRTQLGAATDMAGLVETLTRVSKRRSVAFIVSDFFAEGYEKKLALAAAKHDVIPVVLTDPRDYELANVGLVAFEDFESGEDILIDTADPRVRAHYAAQMRDLREARRTLFFKLGVDTVEIDTKGSYVRPIRDLFARRGRRAHR